MNIDKNIDMIKDYHKSNRAVEYLGSLYTWYWSFHFCVQVVYHGFLCKTKNHSVLILCFNLLLQVIILSSDTSELAVKQRRKYFSILSTKFVDINNILLFSEIESDVYSVNPL